MKTFWYFVSTIIFIDDKKGPKRVLMMQGKIPSAGSTFPLSSAFGLVDKLIQELTIFPKLVPLRFITNQTEISEEDFKDREVPPCRFVEVSPWDNSTAG